jgi:hypothetical protein
VQFPGAYIGLTRFGDGKDREIHMLLADRWRKLVLIELRRIFTLMMRESRKPQTAWGSESNSNLQAT